MIAIVEQVGPPVSQPAVPMGRSKADLLSTISASRLGTWLSCRLKFYFRYVLGLRKPNTPARHLGKVVHAVLQQWNLARWRGASFTGEMIDQVFRGNWVAAAEGDSAIWNGEEKTTKELGLRLVQMYLRETPIAVAERPMGVEVALEKDLTRLGLPKLIGVVDLVRPGGRIVDFKTTAKTPNEQLALHTNDVQLSAYALLYREATRRRETALELHHLVKLKTPKLVVTVAPPATETQTSRFFRLVESYVRGVEAEDYAPAPGIACASCEFINECRNWK